MSTLFDRSRLLLKSLRERTHDLDLSTVVPLDKSPPVLHDTLLAVGRRLVKAKAVKSSIIMFIGAHVIRSGVQRYLIDLMERGYISCLAMNGAGMIHDFEFALIGATTEDVARYIREGQFGLWQETATLNAIVNEGYRNSTQMGMGEAVGKFIANSSMPHKSISVLAAAHRLGIPVTVHVAIGQDIIHEHPNFDGAATGALTYNDFLRLADVIEGLENGVVMNFGSAVMAPEVFLKALSMARNVACQQGREIRRFTTLVCDLVDLPADIGTEPPKDSPCYFFRPFKTMLVRTVADGGKSHYLRGRHAETIPSLWRHIGYLEENDGCGA